MALALACVAFALGLSEVLLRQLTDYPGRQSKKAKTRSHPAIGHVMRSENDGIDADGFRNPDGIGDVDLGAEQTPLFDPCSAARTGANDRPAN